MTTETAIEIANRRIKRARASRSLTYAVRTGKLKREPCFICGEMRVHGHHADYDEPLSVVWLCLKHHAQVHNSMRPPPTISPGLIAYWAYQKAHSCPTCGQRIRDNHALRASEAAKG